MNAKFLQIDQEGFPLLSGLRLQDKEFGKTLLSNIEKIESRNIFRTRFENEEYLIEAFDAPFVLQSVFVLENKLIAELPYEICFEINLNELFVDQWDRFHGVSPKSIPFVFSRKAQADFFNLVSEFDDDGFKWSKTYYSIHPYMEKTEVTSNSEFWEQKYLQHSTGWDMQSQHPALESVVSQLKINKCRILVLGCGNGHDANYFATQGHIVTAVDFSETAIENAKNKYGNRENLKFLKMDAFHLPEKFMNNFDMIFEHTFFCAIEPHKRDQLIKIWRNCLVPQGHLLGFFFTHHQTQNPPFGGTEWEYKERLKKNFQFLYWTRLKGGSPRSLTSELVIYAQKLS